MKFGVIGTGVMGSIIIKKILQTRILRPNDIIVSDRNQHKLDQFKRYGINTVLDNIDLVKQSKAIILAIKPQSTKDLFDEIRRYIDKDILLISIMAGIDTKQLKKLAGLNKIVRVMPNTPSKIGEGVIGIYMTNSVSDKEKIFVSKIFESLGTIINIKKEDKINAITALTGSGPAYLFAFTESLIETAKKFGFRNSNKMIIDMIYGSAKLMKESEYSPDILRAMVTSKGGTTEAAIKSLEQDRFNEIIDNAVTKAYNRSKKI